MSFKKKRILVCPLDWGLGHATRCIPVIKQLLNFDVEVILAADKGPLELLRKEFPGLQYVRFPGARIYYPEKIPLSLGIFFTLPSFILNLLKEHRLLKKIIRESRIDAVISDNRYGLWSESVPSVFITHQLNIHGKVATGVIRFINHFFIRKFKECWIPDFAGEENLSGNLSHGKPIPLNCYYIGPLSRFEKTAPEKPSDPFILVIISGPEMQRTVFENLIIRESSSSLKKIMIIRGLPAEVESIPGKENIKFLNHALTKDLQKLIQSAEIVICRSGYSSIMDLAVLGKKAILIPTPGQTEQEYLAEYLKKKKYFYSLSQENFNLDSAIKNTVPYTGIEIYYYDGVLKERISKLLPGL